MTLEEATKIIDNEGCFKVDRVKEPITDFNFIPWEKAKVKEAIATLGGFRFRVLAIMNEETKARYRKLKEEYEMRKKDSTVVTQKPIDFAEEVRKLHEEEESNQTTDEHIKWCNTPALKEPANQFNEALLDEQAKKIKSQKKEIKHLNKLLASRNKEIWDLKDDVKKLSKEVARLNEIIDGKEDLLNKYRINDRSKEEMIAALRNELAEATVNKVNAQALKSAESALDYKDKHNERLKKKYERLKKKLDLTEVGRKEKDLSGFVSDVIEKQKEFNYWLGELNDLINKTSLDEIVYNKEENKNAPSYPTEDDPDEVSLADMVKIVIEAFFDGKSVIIK